MSIFKLFKKKKKEELGLPKKNGFYLTPEQKEQGWKEMIFTVDGIMPIHSIILPPDKIEIH